jgi:hypothetical protein
MQLPESVNIPPWQVYDMEPDLPYTGESSVATISCAAEKRAAEQAIIGEGTGVLFGLAGGRLHAPGVEQTEFSFPQPDC